MTQKRKFTYHIQQFVFSRLVYLHVLSLSVNLRFVWLTWSIYTMFYVIRPPVGWFMIIASQL